MTEYNDLDMMRAQMHELKQDINRHNMVNEKLMRQVMAYKSAWIRQYRSFELFCLLPFIYISFIFIKFYIGTSWLFYASTVIICTVSVLADIYIVRLNHNDYASMPLTELMLSLEKRRRQRRLQMLIAAPVGLLWIAWYIFECHGYEYFEGIWIGALIGGLIGGAIGMKINKRAQRTDAEAINEIKQLIETREEKF